MKKFIFARKEWVATVLLGFVLMAAFTFMSLSQQKFSPVDDELANIPGGYNYLATGRYTDTTHPPLLRYLIGLAAGDTFDVIVPRVDGYPEGLHAVYSKACLTPMREQLDAGQFKVVGFYDRVRVRTVDEAEYESFDPRHLSFYNVNTPQELAEAQRLANEI